MFIALSNMTKEVLLEGGRCTPPVVCKEKIRRLHKEKGDNTIPYATSGERVGATAHGMREGNGGASEAA